MIVGTGIDIVSIERIRHSIEKYGDHFLKRVCTDAEIKLASGKGMTVYAFYAGRWAAKEAISKAIGTGFGSECSWTEITVLNDEKGKPVASFTGTTADTLKKYGIAKMHVSISHDAQYATAMAIAES